MGFSGWSSPGARKPCEKPPLELILVCHLHSKSSPLDPLTPHSARLPLLPHPHRNTHRAQYARTFSSPASGLAWPYVSSTSSDQAAYEFINRWQCVVMTIVHACVRLRVLQLPKPGFLVKFKKAPPMLIRSWVSWISQRRVPCLSNKIVTKNKFISLSFYFIFTACRNFWVGGKRKWWQGGRNSVRAVSLIKIRSWEMFIFFPKGEKHLYHSATMEQKPMTDIISWWLFRTFSRRAFPFKLLSVTSSQTTVLRRVSASAIPATRGRINTARATLDRDYAFAKQQYADAIKLHCWLHDFQQFTQATEISIVNY